MLSHLPYHNVLYQLNFQIFPRNNPTHIFVFSMRSINFNLPVYWNMIYDAVIWHICILIMNNVLPNIKEYTLTCGMFRHVSYSFNRHDFISWFLPSIGSFVLKLTFRHCRYSIIINYLPGFLLYCSSWLRPDVNSFVQTSWMHFPHMTCFHCSWQFHH